MKRKIILGASATIVAIAMTFGYFTYNKAIDNSLLLANLEALTRNENGEDWIPSSRMGTKRIVVGSIWMPATPGGYIETIYDDIPCCVASVQANQCNGAGLDPRC